MPIRPRKQPTDGRPPFDVKLAQRLVGKRVLIGLTYLEHGEVDYHEQKHGSVESVVAGGVAVRLSDGEIYWLPPDLRSWKQADPGEYRLRSTGEVLIDPDYIITWYAERQKPNSDGLKVSKNPRTVRG
jgi:hypothetical protein